MIRILDMDLDAARLAATELQRHYQFWKKEAALLKAIVAQLPHTDDDPPEPISLGDFLWRLDSADCSQPIRCQIDGIGEDWLNVCDDGNHTETKHFGGDGPFYYRTEKAAEAAGGG